MAKTKIEPGYFQSVPFQILGSNFYDQLIRGVMGD